MSPPQIPLEILLMIAHLLTDHEGWLCFADFNSFLKVNRALYACPNRPLWQEAVDCGYMEDYVFGHLIHTNNLAGLKFFLELGADVEALLQGEFKNGRFDRYSNDWDTYGTPLKAAVDLDNIPIARLLLAYGADVVLYDERDRPGYNVIRSARSAEMVQLLLDPERGRPML
ncbi:hypothetical protein FN846DRAFT_951826 [Sphaerosporella brunnea]|uniref:Uncharacterized protein n=1 Tax=Sphaerosporella brunnea TaxID=1250544 RepID=A0A5J5EVB1_9PEZI|nr:hypothetical protein FN846DRAFT_951826 [Sphaerosporella brunnea]